MTDRNNRADHAFAPVQAAIEARRIPGAVLGLLTPNGRSLRHAGHAQSVPTPAPMQEDTIFDLASLTKPVFTTTTLLRLVAEGRTSLDTPLSAIIPDLRQYHVTTAPERSLTLRQCLSHQTHLPAVEPLYTYGQNPATLRAFILQRAWTPGPPVYSDINCLLAGIAIERLTGKSLHTIPPQPGFTFTPDPESCAATEACTWRGRILRGEVHDENAWAMQGAGHAGLFGTAKALLDFAQALLEGTLLPPEAIAEIRRRHSPTRTLGWEAAHQGWSGGSLCSAATIGHTGFTGTGLWIDWERGFAWTLLTNRIHPSRHTESGIARLRQEVGARICTA